MLYADESVLFTQDMETATKTPQQLLREALDDAKMTPTELGRLLGYKMAYQAVFAMLNEKTPQKFTRRKQERVADVLGLPPTHFSDPVDTMKRRAYIEKTFAEFLVSDIGKRTDPENRRIIQHMKFPGKRLPTVAFYQAIALALEGRYTIEQLTDAVMDSDELEAMNEKARSRSKLLTTKVPAKKPGK